MIAYPFRFSFLFDDDWHVIEVTEGPKDGYPPSFREAEVCFNNWIQVGDDLLEYDFYNDCEEDWWLELEKEWERYVNEKTKKNVPMKYVRVTEGYNVDNDLVFVTDKSHDLTCGGYYLNVICPLCQGRMVPEKGPAIPGVQKDEWAWVCDQCDHLEFSTNKAELSEFAPGAFKFHPEIENILIEDGKWAPRHGEINMRSLKKACDDQWGVTKSDVDDVSNALKRIEAKLDRIVNSLE